MFGPPLTFLLALVAGEICVAWLDWHCAQTLGPILAVGVLLTGLRSPKTFEAPD
jgi:hypothetical protein